MTFLLYLIAISFTIMVLMILFRIVEIKLKRDIISENFRNRLDGRLIKVINIFGDFLSKIKYIVVLEAKKIPYKVSHFGIKFWKIILKKSEKLIDTAKGRGIPTKRGSTSFFLSSVSKHKDSLKER